MEEKVHRFNRTLYSEPLKAPQIFAEIVEDSLREKASFYSLNCASHLAHFIRKASIYKKRKLAEAISELPLLPKILIIREFRHESFFSCEVALSSTSGQCSVYKKVALTKVLAYRSGKGGPIEIELPKDSRVMTVYMGRQHTIYLMSNGLFYGAGRAENFMVDGTTGSIETPVEIEYASTRHFANKPHCELTCTSTRFINVRENTDLIIGKVADYGRIRNRGPNWFLVDTEIPSQWIDIELRSARTKRNETYHICPHGTWDNSEYSGRHCRDIVFMVCGRRTPVTMFEDNISICRDGTIFAHSNGTLYKGKLSSGPRSKDDESLVAFMKEVVLPFAVDGFSVNEDGDHMVFYPTSSLVPVQLLPSLITELRDWDPPHWAPRLIIVGREFDRDASIPVEADTEEFEGRIIDPNTYVRVPLVAADLRLRMNHFCRTPLDELALAVYSRQSEFVTGLPIFGVKMMRSLLSLRHFTRLQGNVPVVMLTYDSEENVFRYRRGLDHEYRRSMVMGRRIKVLTASEPEGESRKEEIIQKAKIFLKEITDDINESLECLVNLPDHYRRQERNTFFLGFVHNLITCVRSSKNKINLKPPKFEFELLSDPKRANLLRNVVEDRRRHNEVDREDPRLRSVRVEAVPVKYVTARWQEVVTEIKAYYIHTYTTEFFIKLIDPSLLDFVEDGVINLNNAYLDSPPQYRRIFSAFFDYPVRIEHFQAHLSKEHLNIDCEMLPEDQRYVITTSDNTTVQVPAFLLQLFSNGFDAARCRSAESTGSTSRELSIPVSERAVRALIETLLDLPTFYNLEMKTKEEVFWLADQWIITHIKQDLIEMIVKTAKEEDSDFISDLFKVYSEEMIQNVARHRPDIIFHWKELPFDMTNLEMLSKLTDLISTHRFVQRAYGDFPVTLVADGHVDHEKIDKKWLTEQLINRDEDEDVYWCLQGSMLVWDGYEERRGVKRKRTH